MIKSISRKQFTNFSSNNRKINYLRNFSASRFSFADNNISSSSSLRGKLLTDHFKIIPSVSDGNCLYDSLSKGINNGKNHQKLREEIVGWMRNNLETKIDGLELKHALFVEEGQSFDEYLNSLSKSGTFGDFTSVVAASRVYPNVAFRILIVSGKIIQSEVIEVNPEHVKNVNKEVWLSYDEKKQHYDLIQSLE
ncbi:predicted protein [Naegleria gruberi]|uniref:Predicted protein n=1 Tax=Naegleria gruberi TaxID=5762 RepID=D2VV21_NAEGR|nr:uncharacterized protein NAEGRDRAFT_72863 [Naegleria gruberi]EFC39418.1 predicted protein [Naegleria gruberi]|eukprot:XP_002672162.1 predicted protein [Naegleria gruberi strain NEG-M]